MTTNRNAARKGQATNVAKDAQVADNREGKLTPATNLALMPRSYFSHRQTEFMICYLMVDGIQHGRVLADMRREGRHDAIPFRMIDGSPYYSAEDILLYVIKLGRFDFTDPPQEFSRLGLQIQELGESHWGGQERSAQAASA